MQLKVTTCFVPNTLYLERDIDCRDLIHQIKIEQIFFWPFKKPSLGQIPTQLLQITQSKYLKGRSTNDDSANQLAHTSQVELSTFRPSFNIHQCYHSPSFNIEKRKMQYFFRSIVAWGAYYVLQLGYGLLDKSQCYIYISIWARLE